MDDPLAKVYLGSCQTSMNKEKIVNNFKLVFLQNVFIIDI